MNVKSLQEIVWIAFFVALVALSAFISLPIGPIPFTLQTLMLYACALLLGSKKGALVVLIYLFLGLIGFPFFSGAKSGLAAFLSPTGGFLLAFAPTVYIAGFAKEKKIVPAFVILLLSLVFLYTCGTLWLMFVLETNLATAFSFAAAPFILPDMLKVCMAYAIVKHMSPKLFRENLTNH